MNTKLFRVGVAVITIVATPTLFVACVSEEHSQRSAAADGLEFTGPWADAFAEHYGEATSDFERAVLQDGVITEAEIAEVETRFGECLKSHGFKDVTFYPEGGYTVDISDRVSEREAPELVKACGEGNGDYVVRGLYYQIKRNPENLDEDTIMAECLVRKGAVDKGYTAQDYREDSERVQDVADGSALHECTLDPLGLNETP